MENDPTEGIKGMTPYRGIRDDWQDFVVTPTDGKPDPTEGIMPVNPTAKLAIDPTEGIMYGISKKQTREFK